MKDLNDNQIKILKLIQKLGKKGSIPIENTTQFDKRTIKALIKRNYLTLEDDHYCFATSGKESMSEHIAKYKYNRGNNGDSLNILLSEVDPDDICYITENTLGIAAGQLKVRYDDLNNGQKRMNCGNKIRNAINRGDIIEQDVINNIKI